LSRHFVITIWRAAFATPICRAARSSSGGILAIVGAE